MKFLFILIFISLCACSDHQKKTKSIDSNLLQDNLSGEVETNQVLFGADDRETVDYSSNEAESIWSINRMATVALINSSLVQDVDPYHNIISGYQLNNYLPEKVLVDGVEQSGISGFPYCPSEKFTHLKQSAKCSGVLIAPDIVLTAGHCFAENTLASCQSLKYVFDFLESNHVSLNNGLEGHLVRKKSVYTCKELLVRSFGILLINGVEQPDQNVPDYALVKLDRAVEKYESPSLGQSPSPNFCPIGTSRRQPIVSSTNSNVSSGANIIIQATNTQGSTPVNPLNFQQGSLDACRKPAVLNFSGRALLNSPLYALGHPYGLPLMVSGLAQIKSHSSVYFSTNMDVFPSSSGSAVYNEVSGFVEGVLVRSPAKKFMLDRSLNCVRSYNCDTDGGCLSLAEAGYVDIVQNFIQANYPSLWTQLFQYYAAYSR